MSRINEILRLHEARVATRQEAERLARRQAEVVEPIPPAPSLPEPPYSPRRGPKSDGKGDLSDYIVVRSKKTGHDRIILIAAMSDAEPEPAEDPYTDSYLVRRPLQVDRTLAPLPKRPSTINTGDWGLLIRVDYRGEMLADAARKMGYRRSSGMERAKKRLQRARRSMLKHLAKSS